MRSLVYASFAAITLLGSANAQLFYIPSNTPTTGPCNVIPFGTTSTSATWVNQRFQTVVTAADLGSPTSSLSICSLGFAACGTQTRGFDTLKITMAQLGTATFGATYAANLNVNPVVVADFPRGYQWPTIPNDWADIGLQKPYSFDPAQGDLVIEIIATGNDRLAGSGTGFHRDSRPRVFSFNWTGTPPASGTSATGALKMRIGAGVASTALFGMGCNGLTHDYSGSSQLGQTLNLKVDNGPTGVAVVILGGSNSSPLPIGGGCTLYVSTDVFFVGAFSAGSFSQPLPIPNNPSLLCGILYTQGGALNANTNQISLANYGRIVVGN